MANPLLALVPSSDPSPRTAGPTYAQNIDALFAYLIAGNGFYVDTYGADPTGVADSSVAIQNAITDAAASTTGGVVVFSPGGNYKLNGQVVVPITARHITLFGYGAKITGAYNGSLLTVGDLTTTNDRAEDISILGLKFLGSGGTDATYPNMNGIELDACLNIVLRDVRVEGMPNIGILGIKSSAANSAYWNQVVLDKVSVRFCGYQALSVGEYASIGVTAGAPAADDLTIMGCLFNNCGWKWTGASANNQAAVYINSASVFIGFAEVSAIQPSGGVGGYLNAMIVRHASGIAVVHFENNCNNQSGSWDLRLDTDPVGFEFVTTHSCNQATAAQGGVIVRASGVRGRAAHSGGGTHVLTTVIDAQSQTGFDLTAVDSGGPAPSGGGTAPAPYVSVNTPAIGTARTAAGTYICGPVQAAAGIKLATVGATLTTGSGAPTGGTSGDFYLRTDTPGAANQRLYVNSSGSWVGIA